MIIWPARNAGRVTGSLVLLLAYSSALGCSGSGGSDGEHGGIPGRARGELNSWQTRLVKKCSIADAMPSLQASADSAPLAVDLDAFFVATDGTSWIRSQGSDVIGFAASQSEAGTTVGTFSESGDREYEVTLSRKGGECVFFIDGEEAARATLALAIPVAAHWNPSKVDSVGSKEFPYRTLQSDVSGESIGYLESDLLGLLADGLTGDGSVYPVVRKFFAIDSSAVSDAELAALFPSSGQVPVIALHFGDLYSRLDAIYGPAARLLAPLADGASGDLALDLLILPERYPVATKDDARLIPVSAALSITDRQLVTGNQWLGTARITQLEFGAAIARSNANAVECGLRRAEVLGAFLAQDPVPYFDVASVCSVPAERSFADAMASSPAGRALVAEMALSRAGKGPYNGWDGGFIDLFRALLARDSSPGQVSAWVAELFDAYADTTTADEGILALSAAIADNQLRAEFLPRAVSTVLGREFAGQPLTSAQVDGAAAVVNRSGAGLAEAVGRMLHDMGVGTAGDAALVCAQSMGDDLHDDIVALLARARASDAALDWVAKRGQEVFVGCWMASLVQSFSDSLAELTRFAEAESQRRRTIDVGYAADLRRIGTRAMDQGWTAQTYSDMERIAEYGVQTWLHDPCAANGALSARAACLEQGDFATFSSESGEILAVEYDGRYAALADELRQRSWLSDFEYSSLSLESRVFGRPREWNECDNASFQRGQTQLLDRVDAYRNADFFEQSQILVQIDELLFGCP